MKRSDLIIGISLIVIFLLIVILSVWCARCNQRDVVTHEDSSSTQEPAKACKTCIHNDKVEIKTSHVGDRGVFAKVDIKAGEIVEVCPLVIDKRSNVPIGTAIDDYVFSAGGDNVAFSFGYCSFYNHNTPNNVDWKVDAVTKLMTLTANMDIKKGDEMFVSYGDSYWATRGVVPKTKNIGN